MANTIIVQNTPITVINDEDRDYICLTDMAGAKSDSSRAADVIKNWIRNRYNIEFLGTWEMIHNPDFKVVEFDHFRKQAGLIGNESTTSPRLRFIVPGVFHTSIRQVL